MRRSLAGLLVAAVWLVPAAAASAQPELPPGLGIRQLDMPPSSADDGRSSRYVTDHVEPGGVVARRIEVANGTDEALEVELYAADASVDRGWSVEDGRGAGELASWIEVDPPRLQLDPGERTDATFRIEVPGDASGGERYAAIVAEAPPVGDDITVIPRVGVRVYLSVGGPVAPEPEFSVIDITPGRESDGSPVALIGVENTGPRAIDVVGELELSEGPGGLRAGPFPVVAQSTIGPGDEGRVAIVLDRELPDGPWLATAALRSGDLEERAEATIRFPDGAGEGEAVPLSPLQDRGVLLPIALGLLLLALILLLIAWRRMRDREDEDGQGPESISGAPAPEAPLAGTGV